MKKLNLTCKPLLNGIMAYWEQDPAAADYIITLYVGDKPISIRNNDRAELYCSFTNLAKLDGTYKVKVQAETRDGKIVAESDTLLCEVVDVIAELEQIKNRLDTIAYNCA